MTSSGHRKKLKWVAFALAVLVVLTLLSWQARVSSIQHHDSQQTPQARQRTAQHVAPVPPDERIADYTELLAWFTCLLAVVSVGQGWFLYRADKTARISADAAKAAAEATTKLSQASETHSGHMERSARAAEAAASAAITASTAAETSAKSSAAQAEIARKSFVLTHRPRLSVVDIEMGGNHPRQSEWITDGEPVYLRLHVKNVGETVARFSISYYKIFWDIEEPRNTNVGDMKMITSEDYPIRDTLAPGHHMYIELSSNDIMDDNANLLRAFVGNQRLFAVGRVNYFDETGVDRATSFGRVYVPYRGHRIGQFMPLTGDQYEYEE